MPIYLGGSDWSVFRGRLVPRTQQNVLLTNANVSELAVAGDIIGALTGANGTGPYTFSVTVDADSKFAVSGGNLVVRAGATFDYETKDYHNVTIQALDSLAVARTRIFTIQVVDEVDVQVYVTGVYEAGVYE